jgi:predicted metal-binding membrane protein
LTALEATEAPTDQRGLAPALAAVRVRAGLVALLFGLAILAWLFTADQMRGMDSSPGAALGTLGWFIGVWIVMMAAMMLPSVAPTVALYSKMTKTREPAAPLLFTSGYLLVWGATGLLAYGLAELVHRTAGHVFAWSHGGQWLAGFVLIGAAIYELTPLKAVCLGKCRSPLGFLLGSWRDGLEGALRMGSRHGAWCVGCCWALMAALFALGVMSLGWMAFVAALIALEKLLPWGRAVTWGTAAILAVLGVLVLVEPSLIPGFTIPGGGSMGSMNM